MVKSRAAFGSSATAPEEPQLLVDVVVVTWGQTHSEHYYIIHAAFNCSTLLLTGAGGGESPGSCLQQGWVGVNSELWKMEYYYCPRLLKFLQYLWVSVLPELAVSTLFRNPGSAPMC